MIGTKIGSHIITNMPKGKFVTHKELNERLKPIEKRLDCIEANMVTQKEFNEFKNNVNKRFIAIENNMNIRFNRLEKLILNK
jgi:chaperonin cofactor prefoldin